MTSSLSAASVAVVTRNEPSRVKVVLLASKVAVTPHSFSRFCFRSRQAANAQPTAWLSRSPCQERHNGWRFSPQRRKKSKTRVVYFWRRQLRLVLREVWAGLPMKHREHSIRGTWAGSYRVFNGHETVADPASRGAVPADVRERPLKVPVRSAERNLLYRLIQDQVLRKAVSIVSMVKAESWEIE